MGDDVEFTPDEAIKHLSELLEPYGIRFQYEMSGQTIVALRMQTEADPDVNAALDFTIGMVSMCAQMSFFALRHYNKEMPMAKRREILGAMNVALTGVISHRYQEALDDNKSMLEVVKG